jgi:hypothetical protein
MKLEVLEKAVATAREQERGLESKARQLGEIARATKSKARAAKTRLKLAKQEAKQARRAAKDAKRAWGEALRASKKAAAEMAALGKKIQKARKKTSRNSGSRERCPHLSPPPPGPGRPRPRVTLPPSRMREEAGSPRWAMPEGVLIAWRDVDDRTDGIRCRFGATV